MKRNVVIILVWMLVVNLILYGCTSGEKAYVEIVGGGLAETFDHAIGGEYHDASTLAEVSALVSDGSLDTLALRDTAIGTHAGLTATHGVTGAVVGTTNTQELDNKTLDSSVAKGTWTNSGVWTLPAFTLGATVTAGANDIIGIGMLKTAFLTLTGDQLEEHGTNADSGTIALNYNGYNGGNTRFRDIDIYNGKQTRYGFFDGSASRFTVDNFGATTLQGNISMNEKALDCGGESLWVTSSGGGRGIIMYNTSDGTLGPLLMTYFNTATPVDNDTFWREIHNIQNDAAEYVSGATLQYLMVDVSDGTEDAELQIYLSDAGVNNLALKLTGAGVLYVDDSYEIFDEYDDAVALRKGIREGDTDLLKELGVLIDKHDSNGKVLPGEYMVSLQAFTKLLAGGVYQNRDKIDALAARVEVLEGEKGIVSSGASIGAGVVCLAVLVAVRRRNGREVA